MSPTVLAFGSSVVDTSLAPRRVLGEVTRATGFRFTHSEQALLLAEACSWKHECNHGASVVIPRTPRLGVIDILREGNNEALLRLFGGFFDRSTGTDWCLVSTEIPPRIPTASYNGQICVLAQRDVQPASLGEILLAIARGRLPERRLVDLWCRDRVGSEQFILAGDGTLLHASRELPRRNTVCLPMRRLLS